MDNTGYNILNITQFIGSLVDTFRNKGIVNKSEAKSLGTFEITATNVDTVVLNKYVKIGNAVDLKVISKDEDKGTFVVKPVISTSISGGTWTACDPYYFYGHAEEIANMIDGKTSSAIYKYQKYPMIALYVDVKENRQLKDENKLAQADLHVLLATETKREYSCAERDTNIVNPILFPLYNLFMNSFEKNRHLFIIPPNEGFSHEMSVKYLHNSDGKQQNTLNAYVDAIEISGLKVKIRLIPTYQCYNFYSLI
jgi:hypothetical protein